MSLHVTFWGTRGSSPTPGHRTRVFGGNTSCVSVESGDQVFICDAGTGIRDLGMRLIRDKRLPFEGHLFISHSHWDHIQGFPFFVPSFVKGNEFLLYGACQKRQTGVVGSLVENALRGQQRSLNFPVQMDDMGSKLRFGTIFVPKRRWLIDDH